MQGKTKKILWLFTAAVFLALITFLLIAQLFAEKIIVREIQEFVYEHCAECEVQVDAINFSFVPLRTYARGVRLLVDETETLSIGRIRLNLSLANILNREIIIREILIEDVFSAGLQPDTPNYRLIESILEDMPEEEEEEEDGERDRLLNVRVDTVNLRNALLIEEFNDQRLEIEGLNSRVDIAEERVLIEASIARARLLDLNDDLSLLFVIDSAEGYAEVVNDHVRIDALSVRAAESWLDASAEIDLETENVRGSVQYHLDTATFDLQETVDTAIKGEIELQGTFDELQARGEAGLAEGRDISIGGEDIEILTFDRFDFHYSLTYPDLEFQITDLEASNAEADISLVSPIVVTEESLAGSLHFSSPRLETEVGEIETLDFTMHISGSVESPVVAGRGSLQSLELEDYQIPPLNFNVTYSDDLIDFTVSHQSETFGAAEVGGNINTDTEFLHRLEIKFSELNLLPMLDAEQEETVQSLIASGTGSFSGQLDIQQLAGTADLVFRASLDPELIETELVIDSSMVLENGQLNASFVEQAGSVRSNLTANLITEDFETEIVLDEFRLSDYREDPLCLFTNLSLQYSGNLDNPTDGEGQISLEELEIGCDTPSVSLVEPAIITISSGSLLIDRLALSNGEGMVAISGQLSEEGYDLTSDGVIDLEVITPLIPVDEAFGLLEFNLNMAGDLDDPQFTGEAILEGAEVILDDPALWASEIEGVARIEGTTVSIENITGNLNRGTFQVTGIVDPLELETIALNIAFEGIELTPIEHLETFISGTLEVVQTEEEEFLIRGLVEIDEALYERDLDIFEIVRELRGGEEEDTEEFTEPDIEVDTGFNLDIRIVAEDQLLLITNWAEAELEADIHVGGTVEEPLITGTVDLIDGWFRIQANRFDITSMRVTLDPRLEEPLIELFAEGMVERIVEGDTFITIEIIGPISDPEINLTSDRGLAEGEIIGLITGGLGLSPQALANIISDQAGLGEIDFLDEDAPLDLDRILRELALVDSLVVAPTFNVETGTLEPSVRAERELTDRLSLFGEHVQAGRGAFSRVLGLYELTRRIDLEAAVETVATQERNPLSLSIFYTFYRLDREDIETQISGNTNLTDREILEALGISPLSRISIERLEGRERRLRRVYKETGLFDPKIELECIRQDENFCVEIRIDVEEGQRSQIESVRIEGDPIHEKIEWEEDLPGPGSPASRANQQSAADNVRDRLLNAGYTAARVRGSYRPAAESPDKILVLRVRQRDRLEFFIEGNEHFSDEEVRERVGEAANREVGRAGIDDIASSLMSMYRSEGFADAAVETERVEIPRENLVHYHFYIVEGPRVTVSDVQISGNNLLSTNEIIDKIRETEIPDRPPLIEPEYLRISHLIRNTQLIQGIYSDEGYLDTEVRYEIERSPDSRSAIVRYLINEAPQLAATSIEIEGLPEEVTLPEKPEPPFTQIQINQYIDQVSQALIDHGYLSASVFSGLDPDLREVTLFVEAGPNTVISDIVFRGNRNIDEEVLLATMGVKAGDPWNVEEINASRRDLLRLGLFTRVEMLPANEPLTEPEEVLLVRVEERELRGLRVGTGANSEYGLRLFIEGTDRSLFADGREISAAVDTHYSFTTQELTQGTANIRYSNPFFFGTRYRHTEDMRFQRLDTPTLPYSLDRFSLASYLDREHTGGVRYSIGHTYLAEDLRDVAADAVLSHLDVGRLDLSYLAANFRYDQRDNPLYARRGYLLSVNQRLALSELASEADYYAVDGRFSYSRPLHWLNERLYFANNTLIGSAWTFAGTPEIPISQRYNAGGRTTVRGFRENSLGPRGYAGNVIGGDSKFVNNLELRYEARENVVVHSFFDTGNVFLRDEGFDDLRYSAGLGFRLISPVGPVGFDLGFPLDERAGEPSVRFHFSIGGTF